MNILISNDDGIDSPGIKAIYSRLVKDNHNVYIVAPDSNRSAVSNHITMITDCELVRIKDNIYSHSGFPADCIFTSIQSSLFSKIDLVIAGINIGGNMSTDIIYSGTCAVARQAVLFGIPAIALSVEPVNRRQPEKNYKFDALADFTAKNIEKLISLTKTDYPQAFVNINGLSIDSYKGVKVTDKLCFRKYGDSVKVETSQNKNNLQTLKAKFVYGGDNDGLCLEGSDLDYCNQGYISITRINANPDCAEVVDGIEFSL